MDLWVQMWLWALSAASYLNIEVDLEIVAVQKACGSIRYEHKTSFKSNLKSNTFAAASSQIPADT